MAEARIGAKVVLRNLSSYDANVRLPGFTNQFVVHPHQEIVGLGIEPRHGRTKRACDPV